MNLKHIAAQLQADLLLAEVALLIYDSATVVTRKEPVREIFIRTGSSPDEFADPGRQLGSSRQTRSSLVQKTGLSSYRLLGANELLRSSLAQNRRCGSTTQTATNCYVRRRELAEEQEDALRPSRA